jgi:hypothetical protein
MKFWKMKKTIVTSLLCALCASGFALDFFGIEHSEDPADNLVNLIYGLVQGDQTMADEYYERLQQKAPDLAPGLKIDDLKIPCTRCRGKGVLRNDTPCSLCKGEKVVADSQSLGYLQHKFCSAMDLGQDAKVAWKEAKADFDERRALVLSRQGLFGTIIRNEGDGVLLSLNGTKETVYVEGMNAFTTRPGSSINGYVWPVGTYTCKNDDGSSVDVKRYSATLWMD